MLASILILAFLGLGVRCYYLQHVRSSYYDGLCLKQQCAYLPLEPQRGAILDGRGRVLAASNQIRQVFVDPREIKDAKGLSNQLGDILNLPAHKICEKILYTKTPGYVLIAPEASEKQCAAARELPGVGIQRAWQRHYPTGSLVGSVVGFANKYNEGQGGIEYQFNSQLQGKGARHAFMIDVQRRPLSFTVGTNKGDNGMPINGSSLILTIDATIQQFAREALVRQYKEYQAEGGMAIVADPQTGAILALVTLPDFEPAATGGANPADLYNRVLTDQFEPGSIIKPIIAAIGLDTRSINTHQTFFCENGFYHGKGFGLITEYKDGFGDLTLRGILVKSSNIGMAKVGQRIGVARLYEGLTLFGFGRKTGIELPGESAGPPVASGEMDGVQCHTHSVRPGDLRHGVTDGSGVLPAGQRRAGRPAAHTQRHGHVGRIHGGPQTPGVTCGLRDPAGRGEMDRE